MVEATWLVTFCPGPMSRAPVFTFPDWVTLPSFLAPHLAARNAVTLTRLGGYRAHLVPAALSAGERQLIALARAHLSPARLAILDEATSHLDPAAAARAESALAARPGTLIVIAHRMSSALRAQQVLVLDGSCARIGDHATLLTTSPLYRDLVGHWQADHPPGTSEHDRHGRPGPAAAGRSGRRPGRYEVIDRAHMPDLELGR